MFWFSNKKIMLLLCTLIWRPVSDKINDTFVTAGELVEDDITVPIPMDRLRDMACRMNQILTNLLVSL